MATNTINSVNYNNNTYVFSLPYGVCTTPAATAAKVVTVDNFSLEAGATVIVKFTESNSAKTNVTLNVNSTGDIPIHRYSGTVVSSGTTTTGWVAGAVQMFTYDGTAWVRDYWNNTTYSNVSLGQGYTTCDTAAATAAKTAALSSYSLTTGGIVTVKFTNAVPANATLNINGKGAKSIYFRGSAITANVIKAGDTATFIYTTYYHLISIDRWQNDIASLQSDLASHTHNYAGSSSAGGAATSANKLNTNAGGTTQPIYFKNGVPVATTYTLGASVPSGAKFTDTTYSAASQSAAGLMSADDKKKLDGIAAGANNYTYTLPTASTTLGGVKTTSNVSSTSGLTACPIISGVVYYKDTNTQTITSVNGKTGAVTLTASDVGAAEASHGTHVTYGTTATAIGATASAGSAAAVSRSDHTHPLSKSAVITALGYTPPTTNTTYSVVSTSADGLAPKRDGSTTKFLRGDGTWAVPPDTNTTYSVVSTSADGLAPKRDGSTTKFLRGDGTWAVPPDTNTTYSAASQSAAGLMSANDKKKLDGIASGANAYSLPTASTTLGGVKTTSTVTSTSGLTPCPIISGVPYYKDTNSNTTYTFATGDSNGQIKITPSSGSAVNVSVKGLGSAAYTNTTAYDAAGTAETKANAALASAKTYADNAVAALVASAPDKLNTLDELAAALNDDANFATTVTTEIGKKVSSVNGKSGSSITLSATDVGALPKLTYEWNKQYNAGGTAGYLLIGSFPMYDSNVTIDIDATTTTTYHGTVIIATQNVSETSMGSAHTITVYGDPTGTISDALRVTWASGSRNYNVYFVPSTWSKNLIHIRAIGNYLETVKDSTLCSTFTTGTAPATTTGLTVVNALRDTFALKSHGTHVSYGTSATAIGATASAGSASTVSRSDHIHPLSKSAVTTALGYTPPTSDTTYSAATQSAAGLMSANDKKKLDGIASGANNYTYTLPTASTTLGGVKTTSTVSSTSGLTPCPIISGVVYYKDTNTHAVSSVNGKTGAVSLSASDVGADASGTASSAVSTHNSSTSAHADIRTAINEKANKSEGMFFIAGSGTTDSTNKKSTWTGTSDRITKYYDGLTIKYKIGVAGQSTTTLNINNLGAKTVYLFNTTKLTTHFPVNSIITLTYHADLNSGCWVCNDYDANTNTYQRVYVTTTNAEYPITTRYNTSSGNSYYAEYGRYSTGVTLNPSTNTISAAAFKATGDISAATFNGYTLAASVPSGAKFTDTTYSAASESAAGLMSADDKKKLNGIAAQANKYSLPTASSSTLGGIKVGSNLSISSGVLSVPAASGSVAGVTIVYPAASCTSFSSDSGTVTPLAVQKGAKMFAITRPSSSTNKAITRYSNTTGDVQDSKIIIEDVTNTKDTSKKAQVIAIPAEGGKKMVYGYCTDQVDGTSFIGGIFASTATEYPYNAGLAIGGTSGNLLWKGKRVLDNDDLTTLNSAISGKLSTSGTAAKATADASGNNIVNTYAKKPTIYTATITTTWNGSAAPYTQDIAVSGITANDKPKIDVTMSGTYSTDKTRDNEWSKIYRIVTAANKITVYAHAKTTASLPIQMEVIR